MLDWSVLEVGPRICSVLATLISRGKRNQVWLLYKHVLFVPTDMQNVPLFLESWYPGKCVLVYSITNNKQDV